jgi:hypothetical protein
MTYYPVCNKSSSKDDACGPGTAYPSGAPAFTPVFSGVCVVDFLVSV